MIISSWTFSMQLRAGTTSYCLSQCTILFCTLSLNFKIIIKTNTSGRALAAIISTYSRGDIYPIAFHSRTFTNTEMNYDIYDKELLVIFEAFKKWWYYLEGIVTLVEIFMNHKNLRYFCNSKLLSWQQACWSEFLL